MGTHPWLTQLCENIYSYIMSLKNVKIGSRIILLQLFNKHLTYVKIMSSQ